jgi:peptidoglycan/LPS O-acetylase OafA/YrhL
MSEGSPVSPGAGSSGSRFAFIDGLRGLAALSIVLFHIWWYEPDPRATLEMAPQFINEALRGTRAAVQVLLVISGFVIAYTLRNSWFTVSEVWSFLGRRLVRLVPPYWVALMFVLLTDLFCQEFGLPAPNEGQLTAVRTAAHMAFLQDVFELDPMGAGMWTLCIEMQFYVLAILGWGVAQRLFARPVEDEPRPTSTSLILVFAPLAFASLFYWRSLDSTDPWVIRFVWMFFLGMATWWTLDKTMPSSVYVLVAVVAAVELAIDPDWRYRNGVALATALAIFAAGSWGTLNSWLNYQPLQYLGRISYSLYLIHFPVFHLIASVGWKLCDENPSPWQAFLILASAVPASIAAAQVLYYFVEAPCARWAAKRKRVVATTAVTA